MKWIVVLFKMCELSNNTSCPITEKWQRVGAEQLCLYIYFIWVIIWLTKEWRMHALLRWVWNVPSFCFHIPDFVHIPSCGPLACLNGRFICPRGACAAGREARQCDRLLHRHTSPPFSCSSPFYSAAKPGYCKDMLHFMRLYMFSLQAFGNSGWLLPTRCLIIPPGKPASLTS